MYEITYAAQYLFNLAHYISEKCGNAYSIDNIFTNTNPFWIITDGVLGICRYEKNFNFN